MLATVLFQFWSTLDRLEQGKALIVVMWYLNVDHIGVKLVEVDIYFTFTAIDKYQFADVHDKLVIGIVPQWACERARHRNKLYGMLCVP
jgi:hypothetical protein